MDIGAGTWTEDDNSNSAAAPDGAPEGMAPGGINNVLRAHQGAIKRWYSWSTPRLTGGSGAGYTLLYGSTPSALVDGMTHLVQFHAGNAAGATLAVHALGALPLHYFAAGQWRPVPPLLWEGEQVFQVAYHAASGAYRLLHLRNRTGEVHAHAGAAAPAGSLNCAGQAVSRSLYAGLFAALGTTYGAGDGTSTFNLPDLRDRALIGRGDMEGSAAGRVTNALSGLDTTVLGATGGVQGRAVSLSVNGVATGSLGYTTNTASAGTAVYASGGGGMATGYDHYHTGTTTGYLNVNASGTSGSFSILQPSLVLNYVVRT
jgi:microcystin-dependent protein